MKICPSKAFPGDDIDDTHVYYGTYVQDDSNPKHWWRTGEFSDLNEAMEEIKRLDAIFIRVRKVRKVVKVHFEKIPIK